jgi:outer membrane protein TolC
VLAGAVARQEAEVARQRYEAARLELFYRVKDAYYEYYYLARQTEVTEAVAELVKRLEEVVRTRYAAGAAKHPDLIRAQLELGRLEDRVSSLRDLRASAAARLNAVLGRPAQTSVPWPKESPARSRLTADDDALLARAAAANPELAVLGAEVERDRKAVRLARQNYWPDFMIGADYIFTDKAKGAMPVEESGKDPVAVTVGLSLPIWFGRYRAAEREARDRLRGAELVRSDRENAVTARLKMVLFEVRDAERKIELYGRTLIPKAKESLVVTETAYRAGKANFLDLIDAERVLLDFQLSCERALASHAQRLGELEMIVGQPVPTDAVPAVPGASPEDAPTGRSKDSRPEPKPAGADPAGRTGGTFP